MRKPPGTGPRDAVAEEPGVVGWADRVLAEVSKVYVGQRAPARRAGCPPGRGPRAD